MYIYYVYAYLRDSDKTPYYIGKGKDDRAFSKQHNINLPDKSNIVFLETNLSEIGAFALERFYIRWYGRKINNSGILRNITEGGEGTSGFNHSEKTKNKLRKPKTEEFKNKLRKPKTDEHKAKLTLLNQMKAKDNSYLQKLRKPKSEEHKRKISEARKGIKFSEEHKKNLSLAHKKEITFSRSLY